jgi:nucleoside 2-deoxyribosyltransferase
MNSKCPICTLDCQLDEKGSFADITCLRCGKFFVPGYRADYTVQTRSYSSVPIFLVSKGAEPKDASKVGQLIAPYLSMYVREHTECDSRPIEVDIGTVAKLEAMAETYANTPISAKVDKLLKLLERRTAYPGALAMFNPQLDCPAVDGVSAAEFLYYLDALREQGLIETSTPTKDPSGRYPDSVSPDARYGAAITLAGWARLGTSGSTSRTGFIAMSFDQSLDHAFSEGIAPAITDAGYAPLRVDKVHHNEKICDRIIVEIRRSRFVVADVTKQRQGVYFEAGFAMALGLPVIWCCHKDDLQDVHFDTRQYNHIVWDQPSDLRQQLADRIKATIEAAH